MSSSRLKNIYRLIPSVSLFSFLAISISLMLDYQRFNSEFKDDVVAVDKAFSQQLASIKTVLVSLAGLHHASDNLNQAELSSFSETMLKAYPFIDSIVGIEKIQDVGVNAFEKKMEQNGYIGLKLRHEKESLEDALVDYHLPVNFIEPMTPVSARMLGLDVRSLPNILPVINFAIESGEISASDILISETVKKPSVFMFKALYLGRYPPEKKSERIHLLDSVIAIMIDIEYFIEYLNLSSYQLSGHISNLPDFKNNVVTNKVNKFDMSLTSLSFAGQLRMYEKNYQLVLERDLDFSMINKKQMLMLWLLSLFILVLIVITLRKRKASKDEIRYLAYYDALTELPNRESFKDKLQLAIEQSQKNDSSGAVLFLDIDEFKRINDTLGHNVGDELLKQVSKRLSLQMRHGDESTIDKRTAINDIVTRLGGDEFTVLLTNIKNPADAGIVASRILDHISQPFHLNSHKVYITSSIGIATFPGDGAYVDQLLKYADTAMYHAKNLGKNNYQFYQKKMSAQISKRLKLEGKLHQALERNEFHLYYQPQVDAKTNKIICAEALIRWQQPELGMIMPDEFIQLAEETGQIFEIGEWVINEACRQNREWQLAGYNPIRIAVNLSGLQFTQDELCSSISGILERNQLAPEYLELEITESIMMRNTEQTVSIINNFTEMKIGISIDDFGTGYSSLSYLKKFPLKALKIDKSFVLDIPDDKDDMMITSAIISMAKSLGLKVIAEGVEGQGQIDFLKKNDCDILQGYHFSRPVPARSFEELLKKQELF